MGRRDPNLEAKWRETVASWERSGLTIKAFCQQCEVEDLRLRGLPSKLSLCVSSLLQTSAHSFGSSAESVGKRSRARAANAVRPRRSGRSRLNVVPSGRCAPYSLARRSPTPSRHGAGLLRGGFSHPPSLLAQGGREKNVGVAGAGKASPVLAVYWA